MAWSQQNRPFRLKTPLGEDALVLASWEGEEYVSSLFRFTVVAYSTDPAIKAKDLLLKNVTLELQLSSGGMRTIHGVVSRLSRGSRVEQEEYFAYELEIVPPHFVLDLDEGFDIFQAKSARDVCEALLRGTPFEWKMVRTLDPRPYCFRYRESRWQCVSRLLEQEGVWYRFDHTGSEAKLVMGDNSKSAKESWDAGTLVWLATDHHERMLDNLCTDLREELRPFVAKTRVRSANEFLTASNLFADSPASGDFAPPSHVVHYEFDQQAGSQHTGITHSGGDMASDVSKLVDDMKTYTRLRQELSELDATLFVGTSRATGLEAGAKVTVHHPASTDPLFVTRVRHKGSNGSYYGADESPASYENEFSAIPLSRPYRPARRTPWPRVHGAHVGTVTGPQGEEIFTDKHGRVQVVFKWDLEDSKDLERSCWVRVAQSFAGQSFGSVFLPRIGHEVLVSFLDGNPDNPVVVGSLYNSANMPPWVLPDNKTQSGVRTRSTLSGGAEEFNELRFEDKKGEELVYVQAQKDLTTLVKHDEKRTVEHDRTTTITNNEEKTVKEGYDKTTVEKGEQIIKVADNNRTLHVEKNHTVTVNGEEQVTVAQDRTITVKQNQVHDITSDDSTTVKGKRTAEITGDEKIDVKTGNFALTVDMGNIDIHAKMGNISIKADLGAIKIEAMQGVEIKVGANTIKVDQSGVKVTGLMAKVEGQTMAELSSGAMTQVKGGAMVKIQGGVTMIN